LKDIMASAVQPMPNFGSRSTAFEKLARASSNLPLELATIPAA
jgi:hypothetical protein